LALLLLCAGLLAATGAARSLAAQDSSGGWQIGADAVDLVNPVVLKNAHMPEDLRDLLCGRISFRINCQDAGLTRFLLSPT
jgi:hypothetical protein